MLCQKCHKNLASVRYAEVVDGKVTDLHLCQDCLAMRQESGEKGFEFSDPAPFTAEPKSPSWTEGLATSESCTACQADLRSILETGRVGCSVCYETFPAQLESLLEGLHISLIHRGKVPRMDDARAQVRAELQSKRTLLKTALSTENYEEAAILRDEIRVLESGLSTAEAGANEL